MILVIVESPAKAKTINQYLGKGYTVLASYGHIRDLPSKNGSVLPDEDFSMKYEISLKSKKYVDAIAKAAQKAEKIVLATDPDREGEAIAWHIIEALKDLGVVDSQKPVERIVFSEITKNAIKAAVEQPRSIDYSLVDSQQARRGLDYLFGFTLSPLLWRKLPGCKSAGRVQSVALRIICEREKEIKDFIEQEYYSIHAELLGSKEQKSFDAQLTHIDDVKLAKLDIADGKQAEQIKSQMLGCKYHVASIEKKQQKRNPKPPFITSTLQQEASRKLGFSTKQTMQIAQKLYEGINVNGNELGLITYMRTDGVSISAEALQGIRKQIEKIYGAPFLPAKARIYQSKIKNAQEAHEAIRPTHIELSPKDLQDKLDANSLKLYTLIWQRTMACQMESALFDVVSCKVASHDGKFMLSASGSTVKFKGFLEVYDDQDKKQKEETTLPALETNEALECLNISADQHFTEPPPRYNEASLIEKMVELGIGRPSTYSPIISVIQDRGYAKLDDKKRFLPENHGIVANSFLTKFFTHYVDYEFTAELEEELDKVASGKEPWKELLGNFWSMFNSSVQQIGGISITQVLAELNDELFADLFPNSKKTCAVCSSDLNLRVGKYGAFYACSRYPDCNYVLRVGDGDNQQAASTAQQAIAHTNDTLPIFLKKGPYGWYLQVGSSQEEAGFKRVALPSSLNPADITEKIAKQIAELPKNLGEDEEGNTVILAIGKFGPYLKYKNQSIPIKKGETLESIDIAKAMGIIKDRPQGGSRTTRTKNKVN